MSGKSELRLFDPSLPQITIDSAVFSDINPSTAIGENATTIDFLINGSESDYLDLNDTLLYLRLRVTTSDNKVLPNTSAVTPSNYWLNSLFSDVTLSLNDTVIEGGNHLYPYKATIESIFQFDEATKKSQLAPMGYNEDAEERKGWIKNSRTVELIGALRLDFFNQSKYLLPKVDVRISLQRSKNSFCMQTGTGNPQIKLACAKLYVRRVKVRQSVSLGHELGLQTKNALYSYNRGQVISYAIPSGSLSHFKDNLFSRTLLPKFVIVGMVSSDSFNGTAGTAGATDPFKFEHFDVNSVGLFRDGQSLPYRELYEPNFANELYAKEYMKSIVHCPQHFNVNVNNGITMKKFADGHTFFTFNLSPDFDYTQTQLPHDSNLRLEIRFAKQLEKSINVIVYGVFDNQLQITKDRKIIPDNVH